MASWSEPRRLGTPDDIGAVDLSNTPLSATGRMTMANNGNALIGWFNSGTLLGWQPTDFLGFRCDNGTDLLSLIRTGGSDVSGSGAIFATGISAPFTYEILYDPAAAGGNGSVTITANGSLSTGAMDFGGGDKDAFSLLNRFGMATLGIPGNNSSVTAFIDDLNYTVDAGAVTPTPTPTATPVDPVVLVAHWDFDVTPGTTNIPDLTSNGFDLTVVNDGIIETGGFSGNTLTNISGSDGSPATQRTDTIDGSMLDQALASSFTIDGKFRQNSRINSDDSAIFTSSARQRSMPIAPHCTTAVMLDSTFPRWIRWVKSGSREPRS